MTVTLPFIIANLPALPVVNPGADLDANFNALANGINAIPASTFANVITPPSLGGNANDFNPSGLATASTIRLQASTAVSITGILAPAVDARVLTLINISSSIITLPANNGGSAAANRFNFPTNALVLQPAQSAVLQYDLTAAGWRLISAAAFSGVFTSTQQAIPAAGGSLVVAHGLNGIPSNARVVLHNIVGEQGWTPGAELFLDSAPANGVGPSADGIIIARDAVNITVIVGAGGMPWILNATTGAIARLTQADWKMIIIAYE